MEKVTKLPVTGKGNTLVADIHDAAKIAVRCVHSAREHLDGLYGAENDDERLHDYANASQALGLAIARLTWVLDASEADLRAVVAALRVQ